MEHGLYVSLHFAETIYIPVFTKYQSRIHQNGEVGTVIATLWVRERPFRDCLINVPESTAIGGGFGTQIKIGCSCNTWLKYSKI